MTRAFSTQILHHGVNWEGHTHAHTGVQGLEHGPEWWELKYCSKISKNKNLGININTFSLLANIEDVTMPSTNMLLWHKNYFELEANENQQM